MTQSILEDFRRYASLVTAAMPEAAAFAQETESTAAVQVERGIVFPLCLRDPSHPKAAEVVCRLIEMATQPVGALAQVAVIDRAGHGRPVYRPLLVYAWLQAYRLAYESLPREQFGRWEEGLRPWCDVLETTLTTTDWPPAGEIPAAGGAPAGEAAWAALALSVAGRIFVRDAWTDLAADTFGRLTRSAAKVGSGPFLRAGASDNPETLWFHELVLLHAAASYAVQSEDRAVAAAVARNTEYHLRETQPDHATTQPWGLFAFVWNAGTRPLADELLHAGGTQHPGKQDGVSLILLADALYCLRLFLPDG